MLEGVGEMMRQEQPHHGEFRPDSYVIWEKWVAVRKSSGLYKVPVAIYNGREVNMRRYGR